MGVSVGISELTLAASPDGKTVYMSGAEAGYKGDDAPKVVYRQSVYRLRLDSKGPADRPGPLTSVIK